MFDTLSAGQKFPFELTTVKSDQSKLYLG
ncbi:hypothetical protein AGR7C_Cc170039 [Agrobacterium deltaense Zutra 3/1]|uniref:Uncharacterized protein n=1 Tax=Agrobacterium deltaense Zutra 3/1 TaxID=1183427 RepID=A0A1S7PSD1_9HYPH|nr:hypothetical protein AGR7C_Cc170039 [Agrobacterium deltaense Zutra 3/1]